MPAPSLSAYLLVAAVAAAITFLATPVVRRLSVRLGAVAAPDERHVHTEPTPRGGGAAMLVGLIGAFCAAALMDDFADVMSARTEMLGVVVAAAVIWSVGFVDDVREISAPAKVAGMVLAGGVLSLTGVSILVFRVPFFDLLFLSADWSALVTVLWVLGMATAVNLIDGLDGLAGGTVAIASGTFLLYALRLSDADVISANNPAALWACITLGVCVGFLPHNVHPARIFMGDGGALLLGLLMAVSTMSVGGRTTGEFSGQAFFFFAPIFIPLVILGVPILDTLFAVVRRAVRGGALHAADKEHLHHRLMRIGHGHGRAVLILWMWTALLSAFVLYPTYTGEGDAVVPIGIAAFALALYTVLHPRLGPGVTEVDETELEALEALKTSPNGHLKLPRRR
ncbi:MAG: MraY family glycosyltransferase [Acidimicrobiaceae bacterium]|nr:undecaprenyl/decaprenyl-phosphate alpha-N-acetylglucosaminyl 1-phosphate transferase [Acidimicrobiia bacterium]MCY4494386.1 MraY family glycosyltransferase [Acidimicrobiaceae bacterium]